MNHKFGAEYALDLAREIYPCRSIVWKFRTERIQTEAYFIKTLWPSLTIQKDENFFVHYSKIGTKKKKRKKPD